MEKSIEFWRIRMQLLFERQDIWRVIDQRYVVLPDQAQLTKVQKGKRKF